MSWVRVKPDKSRRLMNFQLAQFFQYLHNQIAPLPTQRLQFQIPATAFFLAERPVYRLYPFAVYISIIEQGATLHLSLIHI